MIEAFGANVSFDATTRTVVVTSGSVGNDPGSDTTDVDELTLEDLDVAYLVMEAKYLVFMVDNRFYKGPAIKAITVSDFTVDGKEATIEKTSKIPGFEVMEIIDESALFRSMYNFSAPGIKDWKSYDSYENSLRIEFTATVVYVDGSEVAVNVTHHYNAKGL
ncbi:MAG: hypothetical protein FWG42_02705 [Clostridiales bacterium]|nr:hypothetical protein [Clostridiales bacterium]